MFVLVKEEVKERSHEILSHFCHFTVSSNTPPSLPSPSLLCPLPLVVQALSQEGRTLGLRWLYTLLYGKAKQE